jgi:hypothetical protein
MVVDLCLQGLDVAGIDAYFFLESFVVSVGDV